MNFRKIFAAFILSGLVLSGQQISSAANVPDEQFVAEGPADNQPSIGIALEDTQFTRNVFSYLQAYTADGTTRMVSRYTSLTDCKSLQSAGCDNSKIFKYRAALSKCDSVITTDCVSGLSVTDQSGKELKVNFVADFPGKLDPYFNHQFPGDPEANLPTGGSTFIVDLSLIHI